MRGQSSTRGRSISRMCHVLAWGDEAFRRRRGSFRVGLQTQRRNASRSRWTQSSSRQRRPWVRYRRRAHERPMCGRRPCERSWRQLLSLHGSENRRGITRGRDSAPCPRAWPWHMAGLRCSFGRRSRRACVIASRCRLLATGLRMCQLGSSFRHPCHDGWLKRGYRQGIRKSLLGLVQSVFRPVVHTRLRLCGAEVSQAIRHVFGVTIGSRFARGRHPFTVSGRIVDGALVTAVGRRLIAKGAGRS
jgi:hypothetical protein